MEVHVFKGVDAPEAFRNVAAGYTGSNSANAHDLFLPPPSPFIHQLQVKLGGECVSIAGRDDSNRVTISIWLK